jgi:hypothetical protein
MIVVNLGILMILQENYQFTLVVAHLEPLVIVILPQDIVDIVTTIDMGKNPGNNLGNQFSTHNRMKTFIVIVVTIPLAITLYCIWGLHKFNKDFKLSFDEWLNEDEQLFPTNNNEDEDKNGYL